MTITECHKFLGDAMFNNGKSRGISALREFAVQTESGIGFIDVAVWNKSTFLAIEIERSNRRIKADIDKAISAQADELLIVVPSPHVKRLVTKRIQQLMPYKNAENLEIFVGCLPEALTRLRHYFPS